MLCQFFFWPTKFARTTNMKIACDPRLRREVTAVARRQTYKTFGVGHNSFQEPRPAQEVTSCSRAARRTDRYSFVLQMHGEDMRGVVMGLTLFWCVCVDMCCDGYGVVCSFLRDDAIHALRSTFSWCSVGCICGMHLLSHLPHPWSWEPTSGPPPTFPAAGKFVLPCGPLSAWMASSQNKSSTSTK